MKSLQLGRYAPFDSFIHRLDPRNKIFCLITLMVAIFISYNSWELTFIIGGILAIFIFALAIIAHVSFKSLFSSLKALWLVIIILLLINCVVPPLNASNVAFKIGTWPIYWESILQSLKIILRIILMLALTMILTATTKPLDLTRALEWYLTPLKLIKFPAHEIAMTISIALRFIPTLLNEVDRIMKAQSSRGVDFAHGKISSRLKAIVSLIIPLFMSAFQRSEELADSMEARGYDPKQKRTSYHKMHWSIFDWFAFVLSGGIMAATITISCLGFSLATPSFLPWLIIGCAGIFIYIIILGIMNSRRKLA